MAIRRRTDLQSTREIYLYTADFANLMDDEETIEEATVTHTPPSGDVIEIIPAIDGPLVHFDFGPVAIPGHHKLLILAKMSDGHVAELNLIVPVPW